MRLRNFGLNDIVELQETVRSWAEARFVPRENDIVSVSEVACASRAARPSRRW